MSLNKINICIIGATGYVGVDLVYFLSKHPKANIKYLCAKNNTGKKISLFNNKIKKRLPIITNVKSVNWKSVDLVFLSLPNGQAQTTIKKIYSYKHLKFIDLSADFRLSSYKDYERWYKKKHQAKELIKNSIYSISEFTKKKISNYRIIGNPGCYPTSIQLALNPLLKNRFLPEEITIDSKSGFSGAGKNYKKKFKHNNFDFSVHAYGIKKHRHMSELDQEFLKVAGRKINYSFNPHLLPTFRGILSSIYLKNKKTNPRKILKQLEKAHKKNSFIKILPLNSQIGTGNVLNTNMCHISVCETNQKNKSVIFVAIDNLVKGAAGQAIQNMNLLYGLNEKLGLK